MHNTWGSLAARHHQYLADDRGDVRARIFGFAIVLGCLTVGLVLVITAAHLREKFALQDLYQSNERRLDGYEKSLERMLYKHEHLPFIIAWNVEVGELLQDPTDQALERHVKNILYRMNWIAPEAEFYVLDPTGATLAVSRSDASWGGSGGTFDFRAYVREIDADAGRFYLPFGTEDFHPGYLLFQAIKRKNKLLGYAVIAVDLRPLQQEWVGNPENLVVTDADHRAFLTNRLDWSEARINHLADVMRKHLTWSWQTRSVRVRPRGIAGADGSGGRAWEITLPEFGTNSSKKKSYLAQSHRLPGPDWRLHLFSDLKSVQAMARETGLLTAAVLFVLTIWGLYLRQQRISRCVRLEARRAIEAGEAQKRAIIEGADAGLITLDTQGAVESFNPIAEKLFGYHHTEVEGKSLAGLIDGECVLAYRRFITRERSDADERTARRWEAIGRRKYGTVFPMDLTVSTLPEYFEEAFVATVNDISERKAAEETLRKAHTELEQRVRERTWELRQSNEKLHREVEERKKADRELRAAQAQLIHAGKLAALGQMSSAIAHELNQPLAALRTLAASARLLAERKRWEEICENLELIRELTERMERITDQLRSFVRKDAAPLEPVPVKRCVQRALAVLNPRIRQEGVELVQKLPADELMIRGEEVGLERVLVNLIQNALDAVRTAPAKRVILRLKKEDGRLLIAVEDTGPGIRDEHLTQVFEPFFSTKQIGEGLGLGLALSYGIIEAFGGTIEGGNNPQGGAVFTVRFPICQETDSRREQESVWRSGTS